MFLESKVVQTAFMFLQISQSHHENCCLPLPLLLLQLASGDMLPTAASVLSTLHWPASWRLALEFRACVVRSEVGCLSACLIQQEHKGPATVVCTFEPLKEGLCWFLRFQSKGVHSEVRGGSLQCENNTGLWFRLQSRCLARSSLIVVALYVWKDLRAAGLFVCVLWFAGEHAAGATSEWSRGWRKGRLQEVRCDTKIKWS